MRSSARSLVAPLAAAALLLALAATPVLAEHSHLHTSMGDDDDSDPAWLMSGTWTGGLDHDHPGRLYLNLECRDDARSSRSQWGEVESGQIEGLDLRSLGSGRTPVDFTVKRDAGTIHLHGEWSGTRGGGTFELQPDARFAAELERRGAGRPTPAQHARLLLSNANLGLLDALAREKYATPRVAMLLRMTEHAVREQTVADFAKVGYRLESLDALVTAVDHGVNPEFITEMSQAGYRNLEFEALLQARDHGADASFVEDLADAGYTSVPLEEVIRARDHGVDGGYVASLKRAGFDRLTLDEAIRARDHGVTSGYARHMREKQPHCTLDDVIGWRDRGVRF